MHSSVQFSSGQSLSRVRFFATPWTAACRPPCPSLTPGVHPNPCPLSRWCHPTNLILCCPLLLRPSIFPRIRVFSDESALHIRWPKYWSFSFSISPSSEHPGLICFRMDWLDLLAVQGTPKISRVFSNTKVQKHQFLEVFIQIPYSFYIGSYFLLFFSFLYTLDKSLC